MDRLQILLVGIPVFLLCSDLINLFTPPPAKPHAPAHHQQHQHHAGHEHGGLASGTPPLQQVPDLAAPVKRGTGYGTTVEISFCSSCSYRGTAVTMKKMLENYFPGITVILSNYPPPMPKRLLNKAVPIVQAGVFGIVMAGDRIFPLFGYAAPPPWYFQLRANRFGSIATTWLMGNMVQSFLQSSGAFEVSCNGELVYSKLTEGRFPGELELKDLVNQRLSISSSKFGDDLGNYWSE